MLGKVNPLSITDDELVFSPLELGIVSFDTWYDRLKRNGHELVCITLRIDIFQALADALRCLINNNLPELKNTYTDDICSCILPLACSFKHGSYFQTDSLCRRRVVSHVCPLFALGFIL